MNRLFVPTLGPSDWRRLLADPQKQWRRTKSAYEMAVAFEAARELPRGLPPVVAQRLDASQDLANATLIIGFPELRVDLPGGGHASQTDFWALLDRGGEFVSAAFEAKAGEPLGDTVDQWLSKGKPGHHRGERLRAICDHLCVSSDRVNEIRYQLLHRTASALILAKRFRASKALLLVMSFDCKKDEKSLKAFEAFGRVFGRELAENSVAELPQCGPTRLFAGWISTSPAEPTELGLAI